jgi:hypothetical protein
MQIQEYKLKQINEISRLFFEIVRYIIANQLIFIYSKVDHTYLQLKIFLFTTC